MTDVLKIRRLANHFEQNIKGDEAKRQRIVDGLRTMLDRADESAAGWFAAWDFCREVEEEANVGTLSAKGWRRVANLVEIRGRDFLYWSERDEALYRAMCDQHREAQG